MAARCISCVIARSRSRGLRRGNPRLLNEGRQQRMAASFVNEYGLPRQDLAVLPRNDTLKDSLTPVFSAIGFHTNKFVFAADRDLYHRTRTRAFFFSPALRGSRMPPYARETEKCAQRRQALPVLVNELAAGALVRIPQKHFAPRRVRLLPAGAPRREKFFKNLSQTFTKPALCSVYTDGNGSFRGDPPAIMIENSDERSAQCTTDSILTPT